MLKSNPQHDKPAIGTAVARIAGTTAVALTLILGVAVATQPAMAQSLSATPAVQTIEQTASSSAITQVGFKKYGGFKKHGGFRRHGFRGGHRFKSFGFKKQGFGHGFRHGGFKKFGHSGVAVKKFGTPHRGFYSKSYKPHGSFGFKGFKGFKHH